MIQDPIYTKVSGELILPYASPTGTSLPIEKGRVIYKRGYVTPAGSYVAMSEQIIAPIVDGVVEERSLLTGSVWRVTIEPIGVSYRHQFHFITEGESQNLRDVIPVRLDGLDYVKGESGLSAYELAVRAGFVGTQKQWLDSLPGKTGPAGFGVGVNVKRVEKGALSISGPSVARLERGTVVIRNAAQSGLPSWSVNPLALMAGRSISSLWYDSVDNMIYSGYGDWTANGDEIGVVRHSVSTGDAEVVYFPENGQSAYQPTFRRRGAWTEAIETFFRFGDSLYIPHTDGAGYWEGCGYITNEGGEWHEVSLPGQCLHLFAMAQTSEGLWAAGSAIYASQGDAGGTLWFRPTGGDWTIRHQADAEGMSFSRFYQIHVKDDRAWVHDSETMGQDVYGFNATDMVSRKIETGEVWYRNITDQITVGDYTYRGGPMGKITKERKR